MLTSSSPRLILSSTPFYYKISRNFFFKNKEKNKMFPLVFSITKRNDFNFIWKSYSLVFVLLGFVRNPKTNRKKVKKSGSNRGVSGKGVLVGSCLWRLCRRRRWRWWGWFLFGRLLSFLLRHSNSTVATASASAGAFLWFLPRVLSLESSVLVLVNRGLARTISEEFSSDLINN